MDKEKIYQQMCEFSEVLFTEPLTRENFESDKWPDIKNGLDVLKTKGVLLVEGKSDLPYLYFRDGQAPIAQINTAANLPIKWNDNSEKFPIELREAAIVDLAAKISVLPDCENKSIRVCFAADESDNIRQMFCNMALREEIVMRK